MMPLAKGVRKQRGRGRAPQRKCTALIKTIMDIRGVSLPVAQVSPATTLFRGVDAEQAALLRTGVGRDRMWFAGEDVAKYYVTNSGKSRGELLRFVPRGDGLRLVDFGNPETFKALPRLLGAVPMHNDHDLLDFIWRPSASTVETEPAKLLAALQPWIEGADTHGPRLSRTFCMVEGFGPDCWARNVSQKGVDVWRAVQQGGASNAHTNMTQAFVNAVSSRAGSLKVRVDSSRRLHYSNMAVKNAILTWLQGLEDIDGFYSPTMEPLFRNQGCGAEVALVDPMQKMELLSADAQSVSEFCG